MESKRGGERERKEGDGNMATAWMSSTPGLGRAGAGLSSNYLCYTSMCILPKNCNIVIA